MIPSNVDTAWAAGLYEGEGTITTTTPSSNSRPLNYIIVRVVMCDEEPVRKFHDVVGVGNFYGPYNNGHVNRKQIYKWQASKYSDCEKVINLLWDYLSERRQQQVIDVYAKYRLGRVAS
jgi:hypothetical protein